MGVYTSAYIDNKLYENDLLYTTQKLCKMLNKELYVEHEDFTFDYKNDMNKKKKYIFTNVYPEKNIEDYLKNENCLGLYIPDKYFTQESIWMSNTSVRIDIPSLHFRLFEDYIF
jgi:hypothetical protein